MSEQQLIALRNIIQRFHVLAWNNEQVRRGLRIYIANHDATIILIHDVGRRISTQDFTKQTVTLTHTRMITQTSVDLRLPRPPANGGATSQNLVVAQCPRRRLSISFRSSRS